MHNIVVEPYSFPYQNAVCSGDNYIFSPAFYVDFGQVHSKDSMESTSSGSHQFRVDYTKIGRYECSFLDGSFGYRKENEITLLAPSNL